MIDIRLAKAIQNNDINDLIRLLDSGADPNAGVREPEGNSLHIAAYYGNAACLKILIDRGGNVKLLDNNSETPLYYAAKHGHTECIKLLLESGIDIESRGWMQKRSALHWTALNGHSDSTGLLIAKGANVNAHDYRIHTPLHLAAWGGNVEVMKQLAGAGANLQMYNMNGETPLDILKAEHPKLYRKHLKEIKWIPAERVRLMQEDSAQGSITGYEFDI